MINSAARAALEDLVSRDDPTILGLVLSGSAARGLATERSDVDVYVVRADSEGLATMRSPAIDEIPTSLAELEQVDRYGTGDWYFRGPSEDVSTRLAGAKRPERAATRACSRALTVTEAGRSRTPAGSTVS